MFVKLVKVTFTFRSKFNSSLFILAQELLSGFDNMGLNLAKRGPATIRFKFSVFRLTPLDQQLLFSGLN